MYDCPTDLTIRVVDAPILQSCGPWLLPSLAIQCREEHLQNQRPNGEDLVFHVQLNSRGLGPFVYGPKHGRFLYLAWLGTRDGVRAMFRRIKIPLPKAIYAPMSITISGKGPKGLPACAQAIVIEPWKPTL